MRGNGQSNARAWRGAEKSPSQKRGGGRRGREAGSKMCAPSSGSTARASVLGTVTAPRMACTALAAVRAAITNYVHTEHRNQNISRECPPRGRFSALHSSYFIIIYCNIIIVVVSPQAALPSNRDIHSLPNRKDSLRELAVAKALGIPSCCERAGSTRVHGERVPPGAAGGARAYCAWWR